ncbi:hypothetical protein ZWY2020_017294 [Hordeum vulgare]|uniref:RING-type domain-containing protein n=1 Tax=Hordeum vulgare subsp. vulgare TaxID=112509 RepID=A0A8I6YC08_HORVV|nr:hypothetical protein ZWY2020_017294 [Hordeum vulgare]
MSPALALDLEVAAVVAVAVLIVALAAAASGACRDDAGTAAAAAEDVERALGGATLVAYAQAGEAARARQRCCAFCQSEYVKAPGELVRVVPACGHFFHAACDADRWIRTRRTCPLCRGALWPPAPRPPVRAAAVVVVA